MITKLLLTTVLVVAGNYIAERWVLTTGAEGDPGFVQIVPGWGMDDFAQALTIALVVVFGAGILGKFLGRKAKG